MRWIFSGLVAGMTAFAFEAVAEGDTAIGKKLFEGFLRCSNCHSLEPGTTKVGPTLAGLIGRKAGTVEEYGKYSEAMVNSGVVWNEDTLGEFLTDPQKFIPENKMVESGYFVVGRVTSDQHRADLIAYIKKATSP